MTRDSSDLPRLEPLKIKKDVKVCSRRPMTMASSSADEDYHGGASVKVPFIWESQPGTPKVKFRQDNSLPPLTPPPSYFCNTPKGTTSRKQSKPNNLLVTIFSKRATRKASLQESPTSSSSSSSSWSRLSPPWSPSFSKSSSKSSSIATQYRERNGTLSPRRSCDARMAEDEEHEYGKSTVSVLCFGIGREANARSKGRYASTIKVLLKDYK